MSEFGFVDEKLLEVEEGQRLVLEIGGHPKPRAHLVPGLEHAKIVHLNVDPNQYHDILADASDMPPELYGKFDDVFASHCLEHFSYWKTNKILEGWVKCLKEGGMLHIVVPSLEWAAREVLSEKPSPAVYAQLYAGQVNQWDVHLTGFTMRKLRQLLEASGISCTIANTGVYRVRVKDIGELEAMEHYVAGIKGAPALRKE